MMLVSFSVLFSLFFFFFSFLIYELFSSIPWPWDEVYYIFYVWTGVCFIPRRRWMVLFHVMLILEEDWIRNFYPFHCCISIVASNCIWIDSSPFLDSSIYAFHLHTLFIWWTWRRRKQNKPMCRMMVSELLTSPNANPAGYLIMPSCQWWNHLDPRLPSWVPSKRCLSTTVLKNTTINEGFTSLFLATNTILQGSRSMSSPQVFDSSFPL